MARKCPKGHQLNEKGLCGTCWELNPTSLNYRNAKRTGAHWLKSPPSSNAEGEAALCFETCRFCNPKGGK
jgi:hypothetical protein